MKIVLFLLFAHAIFAQEAPPSAAPAVCATTTNNKSVILVDPKARANDWVQTFDLLRKDKPTLKITARTASGMVMNVTDISAAPGGTLLWIKILSNQGTKTQVVPVEDMMEINYSP